MILIEATRHQQANPKPLILHPIASTHNVRFTATYNLQTNHNIYNINMPQ